MNLTLLVFLLAAVVTDMTSGKISNRLIVCALMSGLAYRIFGEGGEGLQTFHIQISIPVILFYLLFQMRALGAGDIKLFSVIGAFLSVQTLLWVMLVSLCAGAVLGLGKILYQKVILGKPRGEYTIIHFSFAILLAYIICVWGCIFE